MRGPHVPHFLLAAAVTALLSCWTRLWPSACRIARRLAVLGPLAPLRRHVARLPPLAALPLFLVPEACSRCGTLLSAWLLLQGQGWRALAVYAAAKLVVGATALWIYTACEPALLKIRLFAAIHRALGAMRAAVAARMDGIAGRIAKGTAPPP